MSMQTMGTAPARNQMRAAGTKQTKIGLPGAHKTTVLGKAAAPTSPGVSPSHFNGGLNPNAKAGPGHAGTAEAPPAKGLAARGFSGTGYKAGKV